MLHLWFLLVVAVLLPGLLGFEGGRAARLLLAQPVLRQAVGCRRGQLAVFGGMAVVEGLAVLRLAGDVGGPFRLKLCLQSGDLAVDRLAAVDAGRRPIEGRSVLLTAGKLEQPSQTGRLLPGRGRGAAGLVDGGGAALFPLGQVGQLALQRGRLARRQRRALGAVPLLLLLALLGLEGLARLALFPPDGVGAIGAEMLLRALAAAPVLEAAMLDMDGAGLAPALNLRALGPRLPLRSRISAVFHSFERSDAQSGTVAGAPSGTTMRLASRPRLRR